MSRDEVERTALDERVRHEDAAGIPLEPLEGVDLAAHREVLARVGARYPNRTVPVEFMGTSGAERDEARRVAVEVLVESVDGAHRAWDPYVHVGSVAVGVVRALRDLGAVPR